MKARARRPDPSIARTTSDGSVVDAYLDALRPGLLTRPGSGAEALDGVLRTFASGADDGAIVSAVVVSDGEWEEGSPSFSIHEGLAVHGIWTGVPACLVDTANLFRGNLHDAVDALPSIGTIASTARSAVP